MNLRNMNPFTWFRNSDTVTSSDIMNALFSTSTTKSGTVVTIDNAMKISTVFSCVRVLSEGIACLPLHLYKKTDKEKSKASKHPLYDVLHFQPNSEHTPITFWEMCISSLCLNGNFYAQIIRSRNGDVLELIPFITRNVRKYRVKSTGKIVYTYIVDGKTYEFEKENVFEVMGLTLDGFTGLSPISYQRETLGLSKAAVEHGAKYFNNDATPPLALEVPNELSDPAYKRLKDSWHDAHGKDNKFKTAILEQGTVAKQLSISHKDSQFLETRQFQRSEIAGMYRVPLHLINDLQKSSFNNISHQSLEFVMYALQPYLVRIEQSINMQLVSKNDRKTFYAKWNVAGLLRGDIESRYNAYNQGRNMGILSVNEIREQEDMNPIENGDIYLTPLNMIEAGKEKDA